MGRLPRSLHLNNCFVQSDSRCRSFAVSRAFTSPEASLVSRSIHFRGFCEVQSPNSLFFLTPSLINIVPSPIYQHFSSNDSHQLTASATASLARQSGPFSALPPLRGNWETALLCSCGGAAAACSARCHCYCQSPTPGSSSADEDDMARRGAVCVMCVYLSPSPSWLAPTPHPSPSRLTCPLSSTMPSHGPRG